MNWTATTPVPCGSDDAGGIRVVRCVGVGFVGVGFLELDDGVGFDVNGVEVIGSSVMVIGTVEEESAAHAAIWLGTLDD